MIRYLSLFLVLAATTALPPSATAQTRVYPNSEPAQTITVTGKRPLKPCDVKDAPCIKAVAHEVWARYPVQIETYCNQQNLAMQQKALLAEELVDVIGLRPETTTDIDHDLPPALKAVCNFPPLQPSERPHSVTTWTSWASAPGPGNVAAARPSRAGAEAGGEARIFCGVTGSGRLTGCKLADEMPSRLGFGEAALKLAPLFRAVVDPAAPKGGLGAIRIDIAVRFPPKSAADARLINDPDWTQLPDPVESDAHFPPLATQAHAATGVGRVNCQVGPSGALQDCRLVDETPDGLGFGAAALAMAPLMRLNLWTRDGQPTPGARLVAPLRFNAPDAQPAKAD